MKPEDRQDLTWIIDKIDEAWRLFKFPPEDVGFDPAFAALDEAWGLAYGCRAALDLYEPAAERMKEVDAKAIITFDAFQRERERAEKKHPGWPDNACQAAAIVLQEAVELFRAAKAYYCEGAPYVDAETEAIQVGAMAANFVIRRDYKRKGPKDGDQEGAKE